MIKTNEYYATVYGRTNKFKHRLLSFFFDISSMPRLLIEVFLRRDMGIRYFSLAHCIIWAVIFLYIPSVLAYRDDLSWNETILDYWGWYLFLIAFCRCSWKRYKECKRPYGYFDFNHFSKSSGNRLRQIDSFKFLDKPVNERSLDVYVEPLIISAVGVLAVLVKQSLLGYLLILCAGIYSLSYRAAYQMGRDFLLNLIDKHISNGWNTGTFLSDEAPKSNFNFYGPKPTSSDIRNGFAALLRDDDDGIDVQ